MKIAALYVRFGENDYPNALETFLGITQKLGIPAAQTLVIDNQLSTETHLAQKDFVLCSGDNSTREFSAWKKKLKDHPEYATYDYVLFCTSAFLQLYRGYLDFVALAQLQARLSTPTVFGHLDCYPQPIEQNGVQSQWWIRTCFFFVPGLIAHTLDFTPSIIDEYFQRNASDPFRPGAPVSNNYREYITHWLTGKGYDEMRWHSSFELNANSLEKFILKAKTIFIEHSIKIQLNQMSVPILDFEYAEKIFHTPYTIPDGLMQIKSVRPQCV